MIIGVAALLFLLAALLLVPLIGGGLATLAAGGAALGRRIVGAVLFGIGTGLLFAIGSFALADWQTPPVDFAVGALWRVFILAVFAPIGAIVTEVGLPEPRVSNRRPQSVAKIWQYLKRVLIAIDE